MTIKQLSIFVENKKGSLVEVTRVIAQAGVDIRAMLLADTQDFGILRLIVSDTDKALAALKSAGCIVSVTDVIGVEIGDTPGGVARIAELLAEKDIDIEYMYAFITVAKEYAYVVFRVTDNNSATKVLSDNGVKLVSEEDIKNL